MHVTFVGDYTDEQKAELLRQWQTVAEDGVSFVGTMRQAAKQTLERLCEEAYERGREQGREDEYNKPSKPPF